MKSSWEKTVTKSLYHFDRNRIDPRYDTVVGLGYIDPEAWRDDINKIVESSTAATWASRGYKQQDTAIPNAELESEHYDLVKVGADPDIIISNIGWELPASLKQIADNFALADSMNRVHVQLPGQVWNRHIDKLEKFNPANPKDVMRIMIQLTDWQPGQFWEFGNFQYRGWRAGDVITFDWQNVPHCTANAGHHPRITLQLTGVITDATKRFLGLIKKWG